MTESTVPPLSNSTPMPPAPSGPAPSGPTPSWRSYVDRYVSPRDWRQLALLSALIVVSVALRVLTWDPVADGGQSRFVKVTLFAAACSFVIWFLVRLQTVPGSRIPFLCAAALLLSGDAIHYVRRAHPITQGAPVVAVSVPFSDEASVRRGWDVELDGGQARFESGAVVLNSPAGAAAYLSARIPRVPDVAADWWLPAGLADRQRTERMTWRASVERTGGFYVVLEAARLLVQAVPYGLHITYPDERDQARGHEVQLPAINDGRPHDWLLVRDSRQTALSFDGRQVWSAPARGELNQMRLGETKRDAQHGGTMRVETASYAVALER